MIIYRIEFYDDDSGCQLSWCSNEATANKALRKMQKERGHGPAGPEGITKINIPTTKRGLLHWLNQNFTSDNG